MSSSARLVVVDGTSGKGASVAAEAAVEAAPDEDLMLRYAAGEAMAFEQLYARHRAGLFRFILRQCGERAIAEELFQDVWSNLIQARAGYRPQARFATWLYTLAHHRVVDWYRRRSKVIWLQFGVDEDEAESPALIEAMTARRDAQPEVRAESRQLAARMLELLADLPPAQREVLLLHLEAGLSVAEIAQVTQTAPETAKSRLRYATAKLRLGLAELR